MTRQVDLAAEYGVVYGSFGMPPYTPEQYLQAENNRLGIQQAIDDAAADGVNRLEFANFHATLGYIYHNNSAFAAEWGDPCLLLRSNTVYDFAESKIEILFDSDNKSPYHTSTRRTSPYQMSGRVVKTENVRNITLMNLEIEGDVYKRSWANSNEKSEEQTTGVYIGNNTFDFEVINCRIHGFMGDSVAGGLRYSESTNKVAESGFGGFRDFTKGMYDTATKTLKTEVPGAYVSNVLPLIDNNINDLNHLYPTLAQVRVIDGSNKVMRYPTELTRLVWVDADENYISDTAVFSNEPFVIPFGAKKVRLQIFNVPSEESTWVYPVPLYPPILVSTRSRGTRLYKCKFYNNHRGGVSNLDDDFTIEECLFWTNGEDSSIGAPLFPDTTRYQIDVENVFSTGCRIINNRLIDSFNGILMSSSTAIIEGNVLINSGGIGLYGRCLDATVKNNRIYGSSYINIDTFNNSVETTGHRRRYVIEGNIVISSDYSVRISSSNLLGTHVICKNNYFVGRRFSISNSDKTGYLDFSDNKITLKINIAQTAQQTESSFVIDADKFNDNKIEYQSDGFQSALDPRVYLLGEVNGSGNVLRNLNIRKSGYQSLVVSKNVITGFKFDNCTFQPDPIFNESYIYSEYNKCEFIDSTVGMVRSGVAEYLVSENFINCKFIFNNSIYGVLLSSIVLDANQEGRNWDILFENCKIINNNPAATNSLYLVRNLSPNSWFRRRIKLHIKDMVTEGLNDFENRLFDSGGELKA